MLLQTETNVIGSFEALKSQMAHQPLPIDPTRKEALNLRESFTLLLRKETQLANFVAMNVKAFEKLIKASARSKLPRISRSGCFLLSESAKALGVRRQGIVHVRNEEAIFHTKVNLFTAVLLPC